MMDIDDMASTTLQRIMKDQVIPDPTIFVLFDTGEIVLAFLDLCLDNEQCKYLLDAGRALYQSAPNKQITEICYIRFALDEKSREILLVQMAYPSQERPPQTRCTELVRDEITGAFIADIKLYEPALSSQTRDCPKFFIKGFQLAAHPAASEFDEALESVTLAVIRIERRQRFDRVRQSQRRGRCARKGGH